MDSQSFSLLDPDPDPGGKNWQIKTEKMQGNSNYSNCKFTVHILFFYNKFAQTPLLLTLEQSFMFLQLKSFFFF